MQGKVYLPLQLHPGVLHRPISSSKKPAKSPRTKQHGSESLPVECTSDGPLLHDCIGRCRCCRGLVSETCVSSDEQELIKEKKGRMLEEGERKGENVMIYI